MRQNPLHTLLLLKDLAQRQRSDAGLNKGEGRNALARTAFFNRLGEIRDRSYEHQRSRASGLIWSGQRSFCGIRCIWNAPLRRCTPMVSKYRRISIPTSRR